MKKTRAKKLRPTVCLYMHIPRHLHSYFKAYCAKRQMTMTNVIIEYMTSATQMAQSLDEERSKYAKENAF